MLPNYYNLTFKFFNSDLIKIILIVLVHRLIVTIIYYVAHIIHYEICVYQILVFCVQPQTYIHLIYNYC